MADSGMNPDRSLPWDWYGGTVPENVELAPGAYVETTYAFQEMRSRAPRAVQLGRGAQVYLAVMFDMGPDARVTFGDYASMTGGRLICDAAITVGAYTLISWNVVIMDTYRLPLDPKLRRQVLQAVGRSLERVMAHPDAPVRPVSIGENVWIGFDACVLPGVTIGRGSIVGAKSVVVEDVEPFTLVAGNPARVLRRIDPQ